MPPKTVTLRGRVASEKAAVGRRRRALIFIVRCGAVRRDAFVLLWLRNRDGFECGRDAVSRCLFRGYTTQETPCCAMQYDRGGCAIDFSSGVVSQKGRWLSDDNYTGFLLIFMTYIAVPTGSEFLSRERMSSNDTGFRPEYPCDIFLIIESLVTDPFLDRNDFFVSRPDHGHAPKLLTINCGFSSHWIQIKHLKWSNAQNTCKEQCRLLLHFPWFHTIWSGSDRANVQPSIFEVVSCICISLHLLEWKIHHIYQRLPWVCNMWNLPALIDLVSCLSWPQTLDLTSVSKTYCCVIRIQHRTASKWLTPWRDVIQEIWYITSWYQCHGMLQWHRTW